MIKRVFLATLVVISLTVEGVAQMNHPYQQAREHAHAGRHTEAKVILSQIIQDEPHHYDAQFLQALITAWEGKYDVALRQIDTLLDQHGPTREVREALVRINYWAGNYIEALAAVDEALGLHPDDHTFLYLRAQVLAAQKNYDPAIVDLQQILNEGNGSKGGHPDSERSEEAEALLSQLKVLNLKNSIGLEYQYAHFSNTFTPWHLTTLSYQRKVPSALIIGRLRYARMFDQNGIQAEIDAYPEINEKTYAYLNLGISDRTIFPVFRWGAELFRELPSQWEASAGMRGLYFESTPVHIYTAHLGRYVGNYWLAARGFLTSLRSRNHFTGLLTARRYFEHEDHFLSLYAGSGATPLQINTLVEIQRLEANWLGLDYQHAFRDRTWLLRSAVEYQQETYPEVRSTDRISFSINLQKRF